ncbi:hypothetical protein CXG81DRAFT_27005 [Caulochytrium protostelioides]|uniref:Uncharacterized protein n=1 Tax=Caulochytrium protostelioides TaxID=1555241 RepID=A0A4P9X5E5_9FUNG|nr:hypothetical protein CXG81DRAFT_27005 [Caulochytrium protostelioides]|eukprot:RKP00281.1 hypothetical protein CXG81DRAFT_27005 [Caulochytrium protostelioides]
MRQLDRAGALEEELRDLRMRFELVEGDRKAYYETSQWFIRQNKDDISRTRAKNKELSDLIATIKKKEIDTSAKGVLSDYERLEQRISEAQRKYDEYQAELRMKEERVALLQEQLGELQRRAPATDSKARDDAPASKQIRSLENRLDKAVIKYNEAQSIRKTYEFIVKRLQDERLTFDQQLKAYESLLKAKKDDADQLDVMAKDAQHAKDLAKTQLAKLETQTQEERRHREKTLAARRDALKQQLEANDLFDRRILQLERATAEAQAQHAAETKEHVDSATERQVQQYSDQLRTIRDVTAALENDGIVASFREQGQTRAYLEQLLQAGYARRVAAKEALALVATTLSGLDVAQTQRQAHTKALVEDLLGKIAQTQVVRHATRIRTDRAAAELAAVVAGVQHLVEKLEVVTVAEKQTRMVVNDANVQLAFQRCAEKVHLLASGLQGREIPESPALKEPGTESAVILSVHPGVLPPYNTRVALRPLAFEIDSGDASDNGEDEGADVPDRETLKKRTAALLNARNKAKQPKKKSKKKSGKESDSD